MAILLLLIAHGVQVLDDGEIRIQKPIYAILSAALFSLLKLPTSDSTRYAFLPADIGEIMDRCIPSRQQISLKK
jgi:hypothetical protein